MPYISVLIPTSSVATVGNSPYTLVVSTKQSAASLLRDLRREQGRTLRGAAADIGVAPSQLSRIERGQRGVPPEMTDRLSGYYGVPAEVIALSQGDIPMDIVRILQAHPEEIDRLRGTFGDDAM